LNAGIPVVGTKMGGIPDFVTNNNGFFEPNEEWNKLCFTANEF
jgi:glycosyltransferase involved in cell wall biosynthesis